MRLNTKERRPLAWLLWGWAWLIGCASQGLPESPLADVEERPSVLDTSATGDTNQVTESSNSICGDGLCDEGELCDEDCVVDCWTDACALQWSVCESTVMCLALKDCVWACPTEGCVERCKQDATVAATSAFEGFYGCGVLAGCDTAVCGDGRCRPGEACDDDCLQDTSCYGRCNFIFDSGKPCQCDANCGDNNDCCVDFAEICEPSLATCGDSVCEPPTESLSTCVFDCGDDVDKCLAFVCKTEFAACYSQPDCSVLRRCLDACSGENRCTSQCFLNASDSAALALQALLGCGERGACF